MSHVLVDPITATDGLPSPAIDEAAARTLLERSADVRSSADWPLARSLMCEFPRLAALGAMGVEWCCGIARNLAAVALRDAKADSRLWSARLDEVAVALEAIRGPHFCALENGVLSLHVANEITEAVVVGLHPNALTELLAFGSDALALTVLVHAGAGQVPEMARQVVARHPRVVGAALSVGAPWPLDVWQHVARTYRCRLQEASRETPAVCATAAVLARLLEYRADLPEAVPTAEEIRHLGQIVEQGMPRNPSGMAQREGHSRGCGLHLLIQCIGQTLLESAEKDEARLEAVFDAGRPFALGAKDSPWLGDAPGVLGLLALPLLPTEFVIDRAHTLTVAEWKAAEGALALHPEAFRDADLRARVTRHDDPDVRRSLALHVPVDELAEHLRWLLAHRPAAALTAIERRTANAVGVLRLADLTPLLHLPGAEQRMHAAALVHHWARTGTPPTALARDVA